MEVIYTAAHAEFPDTEPLGGGKAVADYLIREWRRAQPFALTVLSPRALGLGVAEAARPAAMSRVAATPLHAVAPYHLAEMTELEYARFCREFERTATTEILEHDPHECVVLSNDISEGPDFAMLGRRGYRVVTIFHVDVVEYFTKFYFHGLVKPEIAARFRWFSLVPDVLRLVFQKQYECVRHSARIVVPSAPMREAILRCYPWCAAEKIAVLPWGYVSARPAARSRVVDGVAPYPIQEESTLTERRYSIVDDEFVIMTLSRLSPEKGIERLLTALAHVETSGRRLRVIICGGPAYMKGCAYERKLRRLAAKITTARVEFTGHVSGEMKVALLHRADLFVSPSRHESYGLTIAEALAAGCRVISHNHYGASGQVVDCADPAALGRAISTMIADGRTQKTGVVSTPSQVAEQLAELLATVAEVRMPQRCRYRLGCQAERA